MTLITAPQPAIFALLAIAASAPIVPDEDAETWLKEQALLEYSPDGSTLELSGRGRAFVSMLASTPLPVRVERWDDPRGEVAMPAPAPQQSEADKLITALTSLLTTNRPMPASIAAPVARPAAAPAPASTVVTTIPPGYQAVPAEWTTTPIGQWPAGLPSDGEVVTIWRDGRVTKPKAVQAVIWLHRDKPDDVVAYRMLDTDTMRVLG